jgi:hypothetical protein
MTSTSTLQKKLAIFPSPAKMSLTKLSLAGKNSIIPTQGELAIDIPAGDGKIANLFFTVYLSLSNVSPVVQKKYKLWARNMRQNTKKESLGVKQRVWNYLLLRGPGFLAVI